MAVHLRNRWFGIGRIALPAVLLGALIWVLGQSEQNSLRFRLLLAFLLIYFAGAAIVVFRRGRQLRALEEDLRSQGVQIPREEREPFFLPAKRKSDTVAAIIALILTAGVFAAYWLGFRL